MINSRFTSIIPVCLALIVLTCTQTKQPQGEKPSNYLPSEIEGSELKRSSDIRTFSADSLWVYIDGGAEEFLKYNFIEVSTADYKADKVEIVADIYYFKSAADAKSLFATVKPENIDTRPAGDDGFVLPADCEFIRNRYYIKLVGFDESPQTAKAIEIIANAIDQLIQTKQKAN